MLFSAIIKENVMRIMLILGTFQPSAGKIGIKQVALDQSKPNTLVCRATPAGSPGTGDSVRMWWPLGTNNGGTLKKQLLACKVGNETHCQLLCSCFFALSPQNLPSSPLLHGRVVPILYTSKK